MAGESDKYEIVAWQRRIKGDSGKWLAWTDLAEGVERLPTIGRWKAEYRPLCVVPGYDPDRA